MTGSRRAVRLRGTSVVAAPLGVMGVIGLSLAVATVLWGASGGRDLGVAFWATLAAGTVVGAGALAANRGCYVAVEGTQVRDARGWVTRCRVDQSDIDAASVRRGVWRVYDLELRDGERVTLLGASPMQFPARLLPDAHDHDLADLRLILGTVRPGRGDGPG